MYPKIFLHHSQLTTLRLWACGQCYGIKVIKVMHTYFSLSRWLVHMKKKKKNIKVIKKNSLIGHWQMTMIWLRFFFFLIWLSWVAMFTTYCIDYWYGQVGWLCLSLIFSIHTFMDEFFFLYKINLLLFWPIKVANMQIGLFMV